MRLTFIEATSTWQGAYGNHGKFAVGTFDDAEWAEPSLVGPPVDDDDWRAALTGGRSLIAQRGWGREHIFVLDLQTGEGAMFLPGGSPTADLIKHAIWVCPLFEPFLEWLYDQYHQRTAPDWVAMLPRTVNFERLVEFAGHRRPGEPGLRAATNKAYVKALGALAGDEGFPDPETALADLVVALGRENIERFIPRPTT